MFRRNTCEFKTFLNPLLLKWTIIMFSMTGKFLKRGFCTVLWFVADLPVAHQQNWHYTGWRRSPWTIPCLTFWRRIFFLNFSTPVYKMWIIQEQNTLELWNKLHFEEKKTHQQNWRYTGWRRSPWTLTCLTFWRRNYFFLNFSTLYIKCE